MRVRCEQTGGVSLICQKVASNTSIRARCWRLFDTVLRNFRSEEISCGCFNSHWRNRRESSEQGGAASFTFLRPRHRKRGGRITSREFSDGVSRKRVILLSRYRQIRMIERIWKRSSVPRARHSARRLTTSREVVIRCRSEGGKRHPHQQT